MSAVIVLFSSTAAEIGLLAMISIGTAVFLEAGSLFRLSATFSCAHMLRLETTARAKRARAPAFSLPRNVVLVAALTSDATPAGIAIAAVPAPAAMANPALIVA